MDLAPLPIRDLSNRKVFVDYLLFYRSLMVASGPLLKAAIEELPAGEIKDYYIKHYSEEHEHAAWLEADLVNAGVTPTEINWHAAELAGTQYYLIKHMSPIMLLGYMYALESRPMSLTDVARLESWHGPELCRTVRFHAIHDVDHRNDIIKIISKLPIRDKQLIAENAKRTAMSLAEGF